MNDWWKMGLAGVAGAGLLAATGGAAAGGLGSLFGSSGAAGAGAAGAAGAGAAGAGAAAGAAGTAATTGSVLGSEALTGSVLFPEGIGAVGTGLGAEAGAAAPGAMAFTTPPVTGGGPLAGSLSGTALDYGAPSALAEANAAAAAAPQQGMLAKAGGYAKTGMKAASAFGSVNKAMGGEQAPQQAPAPRPIFTGEAPQIAGGMGAPARNNNAVLAAIARRRQRGF